MAVNTNGLQELLSVIAQQRAMQMRNTERAQEQQNFSAKFEEDKKRYQDQIKQEDQRFKAQTGHQQAMLKLAQSQFALSKQDALDKIQQRATETGQLPAGAVDLRQFGNESSALPMGVGGVIIPELGQINPTDPKEYAKLQGEIKFEHDKPELEFVQRFKLAQDAARDAADLEQRKIMVEGRSADVEATNATRELIAQGAQGLRAQMQANQAESKAERDVAKAEKEAAIADEKERREAKLNVSQSNALKGAAELDASMDALTETMHKTVQKGSFKGKKVVDAKYTKGTGNKIMTYVKGVYDDRVANVQDDDMVSFSSLLQSIQDPKRKAIYGAAFTNTEAKRAFFNALDQLDRAGNKTQATAIIARMQDAVKREREFAYKALSPIQQKHLDAAFVPNKKFVTDPTNGKRVVR